VSLSIDSATSFTPVVYPTGPAGSVGGGTIGRGYGGRVGVGSGGLDGRGYTGRDGHQIGGSR
jgi:hypothetical protein